jgi:transcriptional regulator GlxA family with amidase domain
MSIVPQSPEAMNVCDPPLRSIVEVREYIDRHFAQPLSIDRLAGLAALSPFQFIRAFRSATGETPHQYLRARRIERARELLVTTPMSVTDICDAVGFRSLGSFSAVFKRLTGQAPAQYRSSHTRQALVHSSFFRMYHIER